MLSRTSNLRNSAEPKINLAANFSLAEGDALHPAVFSMSPGSSSPKGYRSIFLFFFQISWPEDVFSNPMLRRTSILQNSAESKINLAVSFSLADLSVLHPTVPSMSFDSFPMGGYSSIFVLGWRNFFYRKLILRKSFPRTSNLQNSAEPKINLAASISLAERDALHPAVFSMSPRSSSLGGCSSIFVLVWRHI